MCVFSVKVQKLIVLLYKKMLLHLSSDRNLRSLVFLFLLVI